MIRSSTRAEFPAAMLRHALVMILITTLTSCDRTASDARSTGQPTSSQAAASSDEPQGRYRRIVSIAPNATELIGALGRADRLVAVSSFCIFPPEVQSLPRLGGLFDVNLEMLLRLQPDLIILRGENRAVRELCERNRIRIYRDQTNTFDDIFRTLAQLGDLLDARDQANRVASDMLARLQQIEQAVAAFPRPLVFITLSRNPDTIAAVMTAGRDSFMDEVIRRAGGENVFAASSLDYPQVSPEAVLAARPDVIIECMPETRVTDELRAKALRAWQALGKTPAVQSQRVYILDAPNALIPSHRVVDTVAAIAKLLHPEAKLD